jgi:hypothetical protein
MKKKAHRFHLVCRHHLAMSPAISRQFARGLPKIEVRMGPLAATFCELRCEASLGMGRPFGEPSR